MRRAILMAAWAASCASAGPIEVSISRDGKAHVLGDEIQPESLEKRLRTYAAEEKAASRDPEVKIDCAEDATVRALFDVINAGARAEIVGYRIKLGDVEAPLQLPTDKGIGIAPPGARAVIPEIIQVQVCSSLNRKEHCEEWQEHAGGVPSGKAAQGAFAWLGSAVDTAKDLAEKGAAGEIAKRVAAEAKKLQAKAGKGALIVTILYTDPDVRIGLWHRLLVELQAAGIRNPELATLPE